MFIKQSNRFYFFSKINQKIIWLLGLLLFSTVHAEIIVIYDANFPESHKVPFQYAVDIWNQLIDTTADDVEIQAKWEDLGIPTTMGRGSSGSAIRNFSGMIFPPDTPYYPMPLANQIAGSDLNNTTEDIIVTINSTVSYPVYLGIDRNTPTNEADLATTILHEIAHGMGFGTLLEYDITAPSEGSWKGTTPHIYDTFIVNGNGNFIINTTLFPNPSTALGTQITSDNLYFSGVQATLANGGVNPKLYAPSTYSSGSNLIHLNDDVFGDGTLSLMTASRSVGVSIHHPEKLTLAILEDLGWKLNADLEVSLTVDDSTPSEGDNVIYTITVTNKGFGQATNIKLTNTLPSGLTFNSNTLTQGSYTQATGEWDVGSIDNASNVILTIDTAVNAGTSGNTIAHKIEIIDVDQHDPDSTKNNGITTEDDYATIDIIVASVTTNLINLSISSNIGTETNTTEITITATAASTVTEDQTIDLAVSGVDTSDYNLSSSTITIPDTKTTGSVTFTVQDDNLYEGLSETATLTISSPSAGITLGTTTTQNVVITDNDSPPIVTLSISDSPLAENAGVATVSATLSNPSYQDITVNLGFSGTATGSGTDYTDSGNSITITAGNTTGNITLTGSNDALDEADETVIVEINTITNGTEDTTPQQVTATITDDDTAGINGTSIGSSINITEGGATNSYDFKLNIQPIGNVEITVTADTQTEISKDGGTTFSNSVVLIFINDDWNVNQTITVQTIDDSNLEGSHTSTISHAITGTVNDANYPLALSLGDVTVNITDNDDITAPIVSVPSNITQSTSNSAGIAVTYSGVSATDNIDGNIIPSCTPASGTSFPTGMNTVTCTATDTAGNTGNNTFTITVNYNPPTDNSYTGGSTALPSKLRVTAQFSGLGSGTVTSEPSGINCKTVDEECNAEFDTASRVKLTVKADSGSIFDRWNGKDCDTEIFLTSNHICTAYFNLIPRTLTVDYPENGVITSSPQNIDCGNTSQKCSSEFEGGVTISLTATQNDGYILDSWSQNCPDGKVQLLENTTCSATFIDKPVETVVEPPEDVVPPIIDTDPIVPDFIPPVTSTDPVIPPIIDVASIVQATPNINEPSIPTNTVSFSEQNYKVAESAGQTEIIATRIGTEGKVSVELRSSEDGRHKQLVETLEWDDGIDGDISIPITIIDNDIVDGNQEVILSLGAGENTSLINPDTSILTIIDDDKPPVINIPVDEIATPSTTNTTTAPTKNTCSAGNVINTTCNFNQNTANIFIGEKGNISYANIVTNITKNEGRISNSKIAKGIKVNGGILSGYITNLGTLIDFEFLGGSIDGANDEGEVVGILAGKVFNNSKVEGSFADVLLAPNAHITGGILEKRIIGDSKQPATFESLLIRSNSVISNVILAEDVEWEAGVIFGENVSFSIHIDYMKTHNIAKLPALGNPIFLKGKTTFAKFTGGASENGDVFKRKRTIKRKSQVIIKSNLLIDVKHIGKQADILVVAIHESKFYMLNSDGKPIIWNGNLNDLIAFQKPENLAPVEAIKIWDAPLDITGSVKVYVGYRLGSEIIYSPENVIEMDFTE